MASTSAAASRQSTPAFYARRAPPTRRVCCRSARAGAATKPKVRTGLRYPAGPLERPGNSDGGRPDFNSATGFSGAVANSAAGYGAREAPPRQEVLCALCTTRKAAAAHIPAAPAGLSPPIAFEPTFIGRGQEGGRPDNSSARSGRMLPLQPQHWECAKSAARQYELRRTGVSKPSPWNLRSAPSDTSGDRCASAPPRA